MIRNPRLSIPAPLPPPPRFDGETAVPYAGLCTLLFTTAYIENFALTCFPFPFLFLFCGPLFPYPQNYYVGIRAWLRTRRSPHRQAMAALGRFVVLLGAGQVGRDEIDVPSRLVQPLTDPPYYLPIHIQIYKHTSPPALAQPTYETSHERGDGRGDDTALITILRKSGNPKARAPGAPPPPPPKEKSLHQSSPPSKATRPSFPSTIQVGGGKMIFRRA